MVELKYEWLLRNLNSYNTLAGGLGKQLEHLQSTLTVLQDGIHAVKNTLVEAPFQEGQPG